MNDFGLLNLNPEEKLLCARICDLAQRAELDKFVFTRFLNLRQQEIAKTTVKRYNVDSFLYGGFDQNERVVMGIFENGQTVQKNDFPIKTIKLSYSSKASFSHRDVLGALMSLGIERDCIGDIHFSQSSCYFSAYNTVANTILMDFNSVANFLVEASISTEIEAFKTEFEEKTAVVASMRLDAVVASLIGKSRSVSSEMIRKQKVFLNDRQVDKSDEEVESGSYITIRGFGKFKLSPTIAKTSKDKIRITIFKYI